MQEHLLLIICSLATRTPLSPRGKHAIHKGKLDTQKTKHRNKPCIICWTMFPSSSMSGHMATCQENMIYCHLCAYQTPRIDFMKRHQKSMHETKDDRKERLRLKNGSCTVSRNPGSSPNSTQVKKIVFKRLLSTIAE